VPTQDQQIVHEFPDILNRSREVLGLHDAQACGELPDVAPAACEHARTDGLLRRQEREEMVEDLVRKGADSVDAGRHGRFLAPLGRSHSVEQTADVDAAGQEIISVCARVERIGKRDKMDRFAAA
jgi:hypothetical protein